MELRETIARAISQTPVDRGGYSISQSPADEHYRQADAILSLPEIKEGEQLRRLCYLHDGPGGVSVQMREE